MSRSVTLKTNCRQPLVQSSRKSAHSRSAMSKLNSFRSSWSYDEVEDFFLVQQSSLTGCISSWRFFRFSSTKSYSFVLSVSFHLWDLNLFFIFLEIFCKELIIPHLIKVDCIQTINLEYNNVFTWRNGGLLAIGAFSGQPCHLKD